jgi:HSP20 family protein
MFEFLKRPTDEYPQIEWHNLWNSSHHIEIHDNDIPHGEDVWQIAVDILEAQEGYIIIAPLAGVPRSDVDVTISRNVLSISGNRPEPEIYQEALKIPVQECFYGPFSRSIILPENLALDTIRATIERGMLIVTIPYLIVDSRSVKVQHIEDFDS